MSLRREIELEADIREYHDRVALMRAKLYRWGLRPNARLKALERELERAERRLHEEHVRGEP